ncbi:MAG: radical SAM protein [Ignavibacteriaceae bacterium]|jgi:MoaA/NifB/PqqE/SkfB family radical SAM enzyme|nr:radical SAM protein [Ignavibacteriaceae bacterium]
MLSRKKSGKEKYTPKYFRNWKIIPLAIGPLFKALSHPDANFPNKNKLLFSNSILDTLRLRKKLLLHKLVYFNNQYYSTPTIPAFPSKDYDRMVLKGGLNFLSAGSEIKTQIDSVFLAITNKCKLKCGYCYERQNINKTEDISSAKWNEIIKSLQNIGVNVFILSGGEPLLAFDSLIEILSSGDKDQSDFHLHTSGNSVTPQKVRQLKEVGLKAAAIGLDDFDEERHDKIRGKGSFADAVKALELFNEAGILTYVNFCVSKDMLLSDRLYKYYEFTKGLNVSMIQLLEPRPCGGYFYNGSGAWLDEKEKKKLIEFTLTGNKNRNYRNHPLIYYVAHIEGKEQLGCHMGGLSHFYIDSRGNVCPCVFFPIKYGNIIEEDILSIYKKMRENLPFPIHTECPSLLLADKCRELFKEKKQIPIPFEPIQDQIDNLYEESRSHSSSFTDTNKKSPSKGQ